MNWIDCESELPPIGEIVLGCDCENQFITLCRLLRNGEIQLMYIDNIEIDSLVTHWMYLPDLPDPEF